MLAVRRRRRERKAVVRVRGDREEGHNPRVTSPGADRPGPPLNIPSSRPRLRRVLAAGKRAWRQVCWRRGYSRTRRGGLCSPLGGTAPKKGDGPGERKRRRRGSSQARSQRWRRGITPVRKAQAPADRDAAQHPIKPTAPVARASGGETRLEADLLAEGLFPHSARRVMLIVRPPSQSRWKS